MCPELYVLTILVCTFCTENYVNLLVVFTLLVQRLHINGVDTWRVLYRLVKELQERYVIVAVYRRPHHIVMYSP